MKKSITSEVSSGQKEQVVRVMVDAVRKALENLVGELAEEGGLNKANFQQVLAQGGILGTRVADKAREEFMTLSGQIIGYLRLCSITTVGATDGKGTIAEDNEVFSGGVDAEFQDFPKTDVASQPTPETPVRVFSIFNRGRFKQIFGAFGGSLDRLCFTQSQIIQFVKDHPEYFRSEGHETFFLFKEVNTFFVVGVYRSCDTLGANLYSLSSNLTWGFEYGHQVIVP